MNLRKTYKKYIKPSVAVLEIYLEDVVTAASSTVTFDSNANFQPPIEDWTEETRHYDHEF